MGAFWNPKSSKIPKKLMRKIDDFLIGLGSEKIEKGSQNHSKMEAKMVQNRTQKDGQEKYGKSVKTNNTLRF